MTKGTVHRKCPTCGEFNVDVAVCTNCGAMLDLVKERELVRQNTEIKRIKDELTKEPSKIELFIKKMIQHPWWLVRVFFKGVYIVWVIVMTIAIFFAWLIGLIVA